MKKMNISIVGGSGYSGGELLRLLLDHPHVEVAQVTSERQSGKPVKMIHPNLRAKTAVKFSSKGDLKKCDLLFLCLPHGMALEHIEEFRSLAPKIIDLSGDFRLDDPSDYEEWYGWKHTRTELLKEFIYGIPEMHREEIKAASYISSAGCNATCTILGLYPLLKADILDLSSPIVAESKCGSSEGGNQPSEASHHPERTNCVRSYKPTMHRHCAEMVQELTFDGRKPEIHFSATSVQLVRGVLTTSHAFLKENLSEKEIWKIYREAYGSEPFIRIVKEKQGIYRYPEPKLIAGTNYCDIGFEKDARSRRLVIISAIDNLMKGAAGQAVQAMNIQNGFPETTGLEFPGLHPI
jgi:N-acetyl-gamma-glutamyl-phosphate/LysW-gamma-L-alpha-aminoadipyl-6-phosphate reductase